MGDLPSHGGGLHALWRNYLSHESWGNQLSYGGITCLMGESPVSWGNLERGGTMMAEPAFPGKLKNTSGPDLEQQDNNKYRRYYFCVIWNRGVFEPRTL